jgi:hypothetical protein
VGRETTEVRGWDGDDEPDYPVGRRPTYYPPKQGTYVSQRALENRPIEKPTDPERCWCGRPQSQRTKRCALDHPWPREPREEQP